MGLIFLAAVIGAAAPLKQKKDIAKPGVDYEQFDPGTLVFYGSQSGYQTLDSGRHRGNPFATAFLAALSETGTLKSFSSTLSQVTSFESRGYQVADIPMLNDKESAPALGSDKGEKRVALVLVISDYRMSDGLKDLAGARFDAERVSKGLLNAGFQTTTEVDAAPTRIADVLAEFSKTSLDADIALIYTTGHGMEVERQSRLLLGNFKKGDGKAGLASRSLTVQQIAKATKAQRLNMVFFAACRDNPFSW